MAVNVGHMEAEQVVHSEGWSVLSILQCIEENTEPTLAPIAPKSWLHVNVCERSP